ncbi:glycosyltransferase family protein [Siphonobacter curvatus]|uniref:Glycosyl transferase family 1 domain-containing protein n=1 Tax=Siphonobacter curvatus TaxID=2094562 RepID=A0A2S7IEG1_9BACT|nr:hypothetical protein [Siphonobacter curvatus]PQA52731.1 hypothetical protein C5O19_25695 [Siphonobacter curvatus]
MKNTNLKILAVSESLDLNNYTRASTFEAISELYNLDYLVIANFSNQKIICDNIKNKVLKIVTYLPRKSKFFNIEKRLRARYVKRLLNEYDIIIITSPNQELLIDYIDKSKVVFLLSDPYHIMNDKEDESIKSKMKNIINKADIILATSKNLIATYLPKYFNHKSKNAYYWPNCVNLRIWNLEREHFNNGVGNNNKIIGFAGNFMNITDIELLDYITTNLPNVSFHIAGKISFSEYTENLTKIFSKSNVKYLNYIDHKELPKEVAQWNVCLMLDKKCEIASYHHHNKIYQYLSLGKPVVLLNYTEDYIDFQEYIYIAQNKVEYLEKLKIALDEETNSFFEGRKLIAYNNSNKSRALLFQTIIVNHLL